MSNVTAHIGIHRDSLPIARHMILAAPVGVGVFIDADGWAQWGEGRDDGVNHPDVYHVTVSGPEIPGLLALIRSFFTDDTALSIQDGYLEPERCPAEWADDRLLITTSDDWAEKVLILDTLEPTLV